MTSTIIYIVPQIDRLFKQYIYHVWVVLQVDTDDYLLLTVAEFTNMV